MCEHIDIRGLFEDGWLTEEMFYDPCWHRVYVDDADGYVVAEYTVYRPTDQGEDTPIKCYLTIEENEEYGIHVYRWVDSDDGMYQETGPLCFTVEEAVEQARQRAKVFDERRLI